MRETSVVTPERFSSGFIYSDYISQIKVNKNRFRELYDNFRLGPEDTEFFRSAARRPGGPAKILVLGEDWCPDVYRGLPVMARIAEASGMELRVFPRDTNMDIMNEFLKEGKYASLPTSVFYTIDQRYLWHWMERPAFADQEMEEIATQVELEQPDATEQQLRAAARPRNQARYPLWQQATVGEIRGALAEILGL